ncbi:MAG: hypothetical protein IJ944_04255 [Clostridia bacterium]|nr:hypothetical protein [Clostridia bacterium]
MNIKNFFTKRNIFILIGVFAVIIIAIIVLVSVFGGKPSKDLIAAVDTAWTAGQTEDQPAFLSKLDELSSYKLNSVKREDDTYIISATVTAPNLGGQLSELDSSELPQNNNAEDINDFLCKQIEKSETKEIKALIYAYKINGEYHITFSDEFADAMSGNLYEYSQKTYLEILQKYEEGELK